MSATRRLAKMRALRRTSVGADDAAPSPPTGPNPWATGAFAFGFILAFTAVTRAIGDAVSRKLSS